MKLRSSGVVATFFPLPLLLALPAAAQAQVTVFGVLDQAVTRASASGSGHVWQINSDGNTSSRLGFRGQEDLGAGLKANFWLEAAVAVDTGAGGSTSTNNKDSVSGGLNWNRRSTIGLQGNWGEVRAGRDYVPSFSNLTVSMHPFGTNGVGSSLLMFSPVNAGGTTQRTSVRASNSLGYFLPELGGLYGNVMVATGENASTSATPHDGNHRGVRIGWRSGAVNMAAATGTTNYATGDFTQSNAGINYKVGPAKLMYLWGRNKIGVTRTTMNMIGTAVDVGGSGELRVAYTALKATGVANDARHLAIGYVHDLSKRTALYGTLAQISNRNNGTRFDVGLGVTDRGGSSRGAEVGVRHTF